MVKIQVKKPRRTTGYGEAYTVSRYCKSQTIRDTVELWIDETPYKKYGLTQDEIAFIKPMIRPMVEVKK
jgi:hypothetical protein